MRTRQELIKINEELDRLLDEYKKNDTPLEQDFVEKNKRAAALSKYAKRISMCNLNLNGPSKKPYFSR